MKYLRYTWCDIKMPRNIYKYWEMLWIKGARVISVIIWISVILFIVRCVSRRQSLGKLGLEKHGFKLRTRIMHMLKRSKTEANVYKDYASWLTIIVCVIKYFIYVNSDHFVYCEVGSVETGTIIICNGLLNQNQWRTSPQNQVCYCCVKMCHEGYREPYLRKDPAITCSKPTTDNTSYMNYNPMFYSHGWFTILDCG